LASPAYAHPESESFTSNQRQVPLYPIWEGGDVAWSMKQSPMVWWMKLMGDGLLC